MSEMDLSADAQKIDKHWVEIFTFHCLILYIDFNSLLYDLQHVHFDGEGLLEYKGYGGKFKFLTFLCHVSFRL